MQATASPAAPRIAPEKIADNCRRLGHGAHVGAAALTLLGRRAFSLCCWCLEKRDPREELGAARVGGGECDACSYTGRDCLLAWERES